MSSNAPTRSISRVIDVEQAFAPEDIRNEPAKEVLQESLVVAVGHTSGSKFARSL